jgi:hypothetical protein
MSHADYLMPLDDERMVSAAETQQIALSAAQMQQLGRYIGQLGQLVAAMQARLDALEKENARKVTISHAQALSLGRRISLRAMELCEKYRLDGKADYAAFRAAIRKMLLTQYAIRDLHDLPLSSLDAAGRAIDNFSSIALVRERREKHGTQEAAPQPGPESAGAAH